MSHDNDKRSFASQEREIGASLSSPNQAKENNNSNSNFSFKYRVWWNDCTLFVDFI